VVLLNTSLDLSPVCSRGTKSFESYRECGHVGDNRPINLARQFLIHSIALSNYGLNYFCFERLNFNKWNEIISASVNIKSEALAKILAITCKWFLSVDLEAFKLKALFLCQFRPRLPASSSTIARWIKCFLDKAGIDTAQFSALHLKCSSFESRKQRH
jgi:hypothetical protein